MMPVYDCGAPDCLTCVEAFRRPARKPRFVVHRRTCINYWDAPIESVDCDCGKERAADEETPSDEQG